MTEGLIEFFFPDGTPVGEPEPISVRPMEGEHVVFSNKMYVVTHNELYFDSNKFKRCKVHLEKWVPKEEQDISVLEEKVELLTERVEELLSK